MAYGSETRDRVEACLERGAKLTSGEVEMLRALRDRRACSLSLLEEQELRNIERKLKLD